MTSCVQCGGVHFERGACVRCGAPLQSQPPQHVIKGDLILTELAPDPEPRAEAAGPSLLEGFEATHLAGSGRRASRPPPPLAEAPVATRPAPTLCSKCGADVPDPAPAFCETCGQRLPRAKKVADVGAIKRCRDCGFKNAGDKSVCTNCGHRI